MKLGKLGEQQPGCAKVWGTYQMEDGNRDWDFGSHKVTKQTNLNLFKAEGALR